MDLRQNKALTPVESGFPISAITIDMTTRCPLACDYCFAGACKEYETSDLTPEQGKKIIDWLFLPSTHGDEKMLDISFWGGEPLVKWDLIKELVLYAEEKAKEAGVQVRFGGTTNVVLLTPEKFDFMDQHNIRFLLSIDGTKEHHDKHRKFKNGQGSWDVIDKNATEILKHWPDMQVRMSYSVENLDGMMEDLNYLYNKGFHDIVYSPVSEGDWTDERKAKLIEMWDKIADWYIAKRKSGQPIHLKFLEDACRSIHSNGRKGQSPCGAGRGYVGIDDKGAIRPCHRFNKFEDKRPWYEQETCIGHIDYGILNQEFRENFTKWDAEKDMPSACHGCKAYLKDCIGGCWATNWDISGDLRIVPHQNCVGTLATIAQAEKVSKVLGPNWVNSLMGRRPAPTGTLPEVQGCLCYNVHDDIYGRQVINKGDRYSCLCNMSTYGIQPGQITRCSCYNVEDTSRGYPYQYTDMTGASCRNYQQTPLDAAIAYLKNIGSNLDQLTEKELKKVEEFEAARAYVQAKEEEVKTLRDIQKTVEK
jgi:uncharacterized protein